MFDLRFFLIVVLQFACGVVVRDGTMVSLVELLNNHSNIDLFRKYIGSEENFVEFLNILKPWVLADVPAPVQSAFRTDYVQDDIDCTSEIYSNALSGQRLAKPRIVVDFVPFGYDFDMLHIRLHETYHAVDAFVVYESTRTQSGLKKPLYFSEAKSNPRFAPYLDKILYVTSSDDDLRPYLSKMESYRQATNKHRKQLSASKWALEQSMRIEMIRKFKGISAGSNTLKDFIISALGSNDSDVSNRSPWGIQNDADELVLGKVRGPLY